MEMEIDIDLLNDIINRLLEEKSARRAFGGKKNRLLETEIRMLCRCCKDIFLNQPNLLELEAPIKICGI